MMLLLLCCVQQLLVCIWSFIKSRPRIGHNEDGSANEIEGDSLVSSFIGLLMLIVGFFGFLGACLIWVGADLGRTNIYGLRQHYHICIQYLNGACWWYDRCSGVKKSWMMSEDLHYIYGAGGLDICNQVLCLV